MDEKAPKIMENRRIKKPGHLTAPLKDSLLGKTTLVFFIPKYRHLNKQVPSVWVKDPQRNFYFIHDDVQDFNLDYDHEKLTVTMTTTHSTEKDHDQDDEHDFAMTNMLLQIP